MGLAAILASVYLPQQDLRTEHGFSRLHDPPGCRHPRAIKGRFASIKGGRGDPNAIGSASNGDCVSPAQATDIKSA
jgi:hypothetical protein